MSVNNRKEQEKRILRAKIFNAATSIILEEGYEKLSMRRIAERIEYSPTVIYSYFRDKADIVNQIVLETGRNCVESVMNELEINRDKSFEYRFHRAVVCFVTVMTENAPQFRAVLLSGGDMTLPDPEGVKSGVEITDELLSEGLNNGIFKAVTPNTSQIITSTLFGLAFHIIGHNITDKASVEKIALECAEILFKGLKS